MTHHMPNKKGCLIQEWYGGYSTQRRMKTMKVIKLLQSTFQYYHGWQFLDSSKSDHGMTDSSTKETMKYRTDKVTLQSNIKMNIMQ